MNLMLSYRKHRSSADSTWYICLPGWAMDDHIFDKMTQNVNAIIIDRYDPFLIKDEISLVLETHHISEAVLVGYSMGAMAGTTIVSPAVTRHLWLSPALDYPKPVIDFISKQIECNKQDYLKEFYKACFIQESAFQDFWNVHGKRLSETLEEAYLLNGLDFLKKTTLQSKDYDKTPLDKTIYGEIDYIVPEKDQDALIGYFGQRAQVLPQTGHFVLDAVTLTQNGIPEVQSSPILPGDTPPTPA